MNHLQAALSALTCVVVTNCLLKKYNIAVGITEGLVLIILHIVRYDLIVTSVSAVMQTLDYFTRLDLTAEV